MIAVPKSLLDGIMRKELNAVANSALQAPKPLRLPMSVQSIVVLVLKRRETE